MLLPVVFFQVCVTLLLIGVLSKKGLILSDLAFTSAIAWFFLAPATLWVFAQAAWASRAFESIYILCLGVALGLATVIILRQPQGWHAIAVAIFGGLLILAILSRTPTSRAAYAVALSCPIQLVYSLYALTQSTKTEQGFTKIELMGMGFFWLGQAVISGAYVVGIVRGSQPQTLATNLGAAACAIAFLWMAVVLWNGGAEGVMPLESAKPKDSDRGDWLELQGELARGKVRR